MSHHFQPNTNITVTGDAPLAIHQNVFVKLSKLKYLDLSNCRLKSIPIDIFNNTVISELRYNLPSENKHDYVVPDLILVSVSVYPKTH